MKSLQNVEGSKVVEVVAVATITVVIADTHADITNATAIVVRPITQILCNASRTPIAGGTGDAIMHQPSVRVKLLRTRTTRSEIISWEDQMLSVSRMWNDGER